MDRLSREILGCTVMLVEVSGSIGQEYALDVLHAFVLVRHFVHSDNDDDNGEHWVWDEERRKYFGTVHVTHSTRRSLMSVHSSTHRIPFQRYAGACEKKKKKIKTPNLTWPGNEIVSTTEDSTTTQLSIAMLISERLSSTSSRSSRSITLPATYPME